jgi:hypothetical protein
VTIDRRVVELPQTFLHTHIRREGSTLILENSEGLRVVCNAAFDVCSVTVSGWYFGKTGGLVSSRSNPTTYNATNSLVRFHRIFYTIKTLQLTSPPGIVLVCNVNAATLDAILRSRVRNNVSFVKIT